MNEWTAVLISLIGGGGIGAIISAVLQFFNNNKTSANSLLELAHDRIETLEATVNELEADVKTERLENYKLSKALHASNLELSVFKNGVNH